MPRFEIPQQTGYGLGAYLAQELAQARAQHAAERNASVAALLERWKTEQGMIQADRNARAEVFRQLLNDFVIARPLQEGEKPRPSQAILETMRGDKYVAADLPDIEASAQSFIENKGMAKGYSLMPKSAFFMTEGYGGGRQLITSIYDKARKAVMESEAYKQLNLLGTGLEPLPGDEKYAGFGKALLGQLNIYATDLAKQPELRDEMIAKIQANIRASEAIDRELATYEGLASKRPEVLSDQAREKMLARLKATAAKYGVPVSDLVLEDRLDRIAAKYRKK